MDIKHYMWLQDTAGCGIVSAVRLIESFGSAEAIYETDDVNAFSRVEGLDRETALRLAAHKDLEKYALIEECAVHGGIGWIAIEDENYPSALREIYAPPVLLFYKGRNLLNQLCLAMVGSRKATPYGIGTARNLAGSLAQSRICIVSGLAAGIDAACHEGALEAGGETVAVLGCGADVIYPSANAILYQRILDEGGMLLSEFFPGTPPITANFPRRNRIISGLSFGTLVVEASRQSGSLITARFALDQNRQVYAVPGSLQMPQSAGCNNLIKEGAKLVTGPQDILCDLYDVLRPRTGASQDVERAPLTEDEEIVLAAIREGCQTVDALSMRTGRPVWKINSTISVMEIKQIVAVFNGKLYIAY
jgi:DNA processing protein